MRPHLKTWKLIAGAGAETWRALAEEAASGGPVGGPGDAKLAALMQKAAEALGEVEKYLVGKEEK